MKTYKETRKAIKDLIITVGLNGITGSNIVDLQKAGHTATNIQNAISYFTFSPATAKYRISH